MDPNELYRLAGTYHKQGDLDKAEELYRQIVEQHPDHPQVIHRLAMIAYNRKDLEASLPLFRQAIALNGKYPSFHNNLANALRDLDRLDEAESCYRQALRVDPNYAVAYFNLAALCRQKGDLKQALKLCRESLQLNPDFIEAHVELSQIYISLGQPDEGVQCLQRAIQRKPDSVDAYLALSQIQLNRKQMNDALLTLQKAVRIKPDCVSALLNMGAIFLERALLTDAERALRRAEKLEPDNPQVLYNLGLCARSQEQYEQAISYFARTLEQDPGNLSASYDFGKMKAECCDWSTRKEDESRIFEVTETYLNADSPALITLPWVLQLFDTPPGLHHRMVCHQAKLLTRRMADTKTKARFRHSKVQPERLKIGYVSPDFRAHAVGALVYDLFRHHDRSKVAVYGYALTMVEDEFLRGVRQGCDVFTDVTQMAPEQMARKIYQDGVHILIDMAGHTAHSRPELFALEPAPVQAHWIGYLDSMGADFLPYMFADSTVISPEQRAFYTESMVYLPDSFCVGSPLALSEKTVTRREVGLPEQAMVYCCFNSAYKIEPTVFDVWMRILRRTPDSVLWLPRSNDRFFANLCREAEARGVNSARLIEAPRLDMQQHLSRARLADLFLDTFIYNAGSTAFNMLWAGVPILTLPGARYLTRMGASLAQSAGTPELVCTTVEDYEEKAVQLAVHPDELTAIKTRLTTQRDGNPLFDLPRFARHLEAAYQQMWDQHVRGVREDIRVGS